MYKLYVILIANPAISTLLYLLNVIVRRHKLYIIPILFQRIPLLFYLYLIVTKPSYQPHFCFLGSLSQQTMKIQTVLIMNNKYNSFLPPKSHLKLQNIHLLVTKDMSSGGGSPQNKMHSVPTASASHTISLHMQLKICQVKWQLKVIQLVKLM